MMYQLEALIFQSLLFANYRFLKALSTWKAHQKIKVRRKSFLDSSREKERREEEIAQCAWRLFCFAFARKLAVDFHEFALHLLFTFTSARNKRMAFIFRGWKVAAFAGGFIGVIGLAMYPIYFYPRNHINEYSKLSHFATLLFLINWFPCVFLFLRGITEDQSTRRGCH